MVEPGSSLLECEFTDKPVEEAKMMYVWSNGLALETSVWTHVYSISREEVYKGYNYFDFYVVLVFLFLYSSFLLYFWW